jgi:hypothetical protein
MVARLDDALERGLWAPRRNAVHTELARAQAAAQERGQLREAAQ